LIHVVLDTSIYRNKRKRDGLAFTALVNLCWNDIVRIHMPYYVKREFVSQQCSMVKKSLTDIQSAASSIVGGIEHDSLKAYASKVIADAELTAKHAESWATRDFEQWIEMTRVIEHPIAPDHVHRVTEHYFAGAPPFKAVKNRADIPDSFIWQTIVDIAKEYGPLHVVAQDGAVFAAAQAEKGMTAHNSLEAFIQLPECQEHIKALGKDFTVTFNLDRAAGLLRKEIATLESMIDAHLVDALLGEIVLDAEIASPQNKGKIVGVGKHYNLSFEFEGVEFYGGANIGIPFATTANCTLSYSMPKGALSELAEVDVTRINVHDPDDGYMDVFAKYSVQIDAMLSFELDVVKLEKGNLTDDNIVDILADATCLIETRHTEIASADH
jgi:PIN domain